MSLPTPSVVCTPRPPVTVSATPVGGGRLQVTVGVTGSGNSLQGIQFSGTSNALVDIGSISGGSGGFNVSLSGTSVTFYVRRAGAGAATAFFTVTDACGTWQSFAGGGPGAF